MSWAADVLSQLQYRDHIEQQESPYYQAFTQLLLRAVPDPIITPATASTDEITAIASDRDEYKFKTKQLTDENARLQQNVTNLKLQVDEKNKQIELVQNEHLVNEMQVLVARQQLDELRGEYDNVKQQLKSVEAEHDKLVKRWMEKVERDAQLLNDHNERG